MGEPASGRLARLVLDETPVGPLTLVASPRGIRELRFGVPAGPPPALAGGSEGEPVPHLEVARRWLAWSLKLAAREGGDPTGGAPSGSGPAPETPEPAFPQLDLEGAPGQTPFRLRVWNALLRIPRGETTSYGALARTLGEGSPRAVGQAVGANPVPVLVPCHRVIASDGGLGGFSGGIERKGVLLLLEGA